MHAMLEVGFSFIPIGGATKRYQGSQFGKLCLTVSSDRKEREWEPKHLLGVVIIIV